MTRLVLVVAVLSAACEGDEPPPLAKVEQAIVDGHQISHEPAVVALTERGHQFCTGTLIAPRVVVTAAHCLPPDNDVDPAAIEVYVGSRVGDPGLVLAVAEIAVHPAWSPRSLVNDVGLVALRDDAPVAPLPMLARGLAVESGEPARLVGFGTTLYDGANNGLKREGRATIAGTDAATIYVADNGALTCFGDSGGPLLVERGAAWVLAGIHSLSDCETESLDERVDVHLDDSIAPFVRRHGGFTACSTDGVCDEDCAVDLDCGMGDADGDPDDGGAEHRPAGEVISGCAVAAGGSVPGPLAAALAWLVAAAVRPRRRAAPR